MDEVERGREAYLQRAWLAAYKTLSLADKTSPLEAGDLELLAVSAVLIGRNDDAAGSLDRAYHAYLDAGEPVGAARCTFWLGLCVIDAGAFYRLGEIHRLLGEFDPAEKAYRSASHTPSSTGCCDPSAPVGGITHWGAPLTLGTCTDAPRVAGSHHSIWPLYVIDRTEQAR